MISKLARSIAPLALAATLAVPTAALALPSRGAADRGARPAVELATSLWAGLRSTLQGVWTKAGSALDPDGGHGTPPRPGASAAAVSPSGSDAGSALDPDGGHRL